MFVNNLYYIDQAFNTYIVFFYSALLHQPRVKFVPLADADDVVFLESGKECDDKY